jgi:hypothetical protein
VQQCKAKANDEFIAFVKLHCIVFLGLCAFCLFVTCYGQFHVHCILELLNVEMYVYIEMYRGGGGLGW